MANPVTWFEIPVSDIVRAKNFYEASFGYSLKLEEFGSSKMAHFPMEDNAANSSGSLVQEKDFLPSSQGVLIYFSVADIEEVLKKIEKSGGKCLQNKKSIGQYGFIGIFQDTEGNTVALHSIK
jgi:predicted enzyme related to lactoylglutathione lyase